MGTAINLLSSSPIALPRCSLLYYNCSLNKNSVFRGFKFTSKRLPNGDLSWTFHRQLSEPFKVFDFDFWKRPNSSGKEIHIKATDNGRVHAIISCSSSKYFDSTLRGCFNLTRKGHHFTRLKWVTSSMTEATSSFSWYWGLV